MRQRSAPLHLSKEDTTRNAVVRFTGALTAALLLLHASTLLAAEPRHDELEYLPIETLMALEVYGASKFVQKISDAPSAVSIVTADEIRTFGWRTLADILRSMPGLHVSNDRNYSFLGARGFLRPGDYNTRFLLLVDGYRTNDAIYDQASIGHDFLLDVDLIDRVEFVPGPGSSIYGSNAFFGVINVITKRGRDVQGPQISVERGSFDARGARMTYGWRGADDAEMLVSASDMRIAGQDLYFPEFDVPETNHGIAQGLDYERAQKLLFKGSVDQFGVTVARSERKKGIPTASFSQDFNNPNSYTVDTHLFVDVGYRHHFSVDTEVSARLYAGKYTYYGDYAYGGEVATIDRDGSHARWVGTELKWLTTRVKLHKLVAGLELQNDYRRHQYVFGRDAQDNRIVETRLDDRRQGHRYGAYLQDEVALRDNVLLNAGLRYDYNSTSGDMFNPRLAVIYKPNMTSSVKLLYGTAYRAPNAYEMYYEVSGEGGQKSNPSLRAERVRTHEMVIEHYFAPPGKITAALFSNRVSNLISQTSDPGDGLLVFENLDRATTRGVTLGFEQMWSAGTRFRSSVTLQRAVNAGNGEQLANSPRRLAKMSYSMPIAGDRVRGAIDAQYVGRRSTLDGNEVRGYWVANLALQSANFIRGLDLSVGIYNLLDQHYADPGGEEHRQDAIPQDGRTFRVKLIYDF